MNAKIERVKRSRIKAARYNPRKIDAKAREKLKAGMDEFGLVEPLVWNKRTGNLVGGHQRLAIIDERFHAGTNGGGAIGTSRPTSRPTDYALEVSVVDLDAKRERKLNLLLNNPKAQGEWDEEKLAALIEELGRDVTLTGFDESDLDAILKGCENGVDAAPQMDKAEELRKKWKVARGQVWELGEHRLMCGDSTKGEDVGRLMKNTAPAAILTDPPYGQNQPGVPNDEPEKLEELISKTVAAMPVKNGAAVMFQSPRTFPVLLDAMREASWRFERMLWLYKTAQMAHPWRGWILKSESILVFSKGTPHWTETKPYAHDCYQVSEVSGELPRDSGWHGSVKPVKIVADIASRISKRDDLVYEPFNGSGTTLIACEQLGRKCRAMEIAPGYVAVAIQRWADATGKVPKLVK